MQGYKLFRVTLTSDTGDLRWDYVVLANAPDLAITLARSNARRNKAPKSLYSKGASASAIPNPDSVVRVY